MGTGGSRAAIGLDGRNGSAKWIEKPAEGDSISTRGRIRKTETAAPDPEGATPQCIGHWQWWPSFAAVASEAVSWEWPWA